VQSGDEIFAGLSKDISFRNVQFAYVPGRAILKNVSFAIQKGGMTAIVGPTGSGKTTIISLLMRYYDCAPGSIFLDGKDIRSFTLESYLGKVAFVSQDTLLLHDSLRNNIAYGMSEVSEERLMDAMRRARLLDLVASLPHGADTLIGDRGVQLSGGEKQRVSIARALLKDAPILILDEATSSLDSQTERLIQEAIDDAVVGRTAIVIAHRLSTIKNADHILVMEDGRIVEEGTRDQLMQNRKLFFHLWEEQKF
jgi:ABC-type multidrug transport system fused ATPase/permease subunit